MENRIKEIDEILKDLYFSVKKDNISLSRKIVYSYLIRRNVAKLDRDVDINGIPMEELNGLRYRRFI